MCVFRNGGERFRERGHNHDREEIRFEVVSDRVDSRRIRHSQFPYPRSSQLPRRTLESVETEVHMPSNALRIRV